MKILFSANDAGGANAVAPEVGALAKAGTDTRGILTGPARDIFRARGIPFIDATPFSLKQVKASVDAFAPDAFLAGTSSGETLDKSTLLHLKGKAPSVYVLDYWLNYSERFSKGGKDRTFMPERICVMDDIARTEMLSEGFDGKNIVVTGNPHMDHFADDISHTSEDKQRILFISQPLHSSGRFPFDEFSVLSDLKTAVEELPEGHYISIRMHPKEERGKYDAYLSPRVRMAKEASLEKAMSKSGLIVGMVSPTLIQAAAAGKRVVSYEPGLTGPDTLVSNRFGVTRRLNSAAELAYELHEYAAGKIAPKTEDFRNFWPLGSTERVVAAVLALAP